MKEMRENERVFQCKEASNLVLLLKSGEFMSSGGPVAVGGAPQGRCPLKLHRSLPWYLRCHQQPSFIPFKRGPTSQVGLNIQSLCTGETRMAGYSPHSQSSMFCLCDVSPLGHMCTCWCMRRLMCLCVHVYVEARGQQQAVFFMWCQVTFPRWTLSVACNSLSRAGKEVFQGSACSWDYKCMPPCPCHHA